MNAAISGAKAFALVIDGDTVEFMDRDGRRRPARVEHARRMLDEPGDTSFIECNDLAEVRQRLQEAIDAADALHLALILLDPQLSRVTRLAACGDLEELFTRELNVEYVERVLYARPLGAEHDLAGARALASTRSVRRFLAGLEAVQPASARFLAAWERTPESFFVGTSRQETFAIFTRAGLVRKFVKALASSSSTKDFLSRSLTFDDHHRMRIILWLARHGLDLMPISYEHHHDHPVSIAHDGDPETYTGKSAAATTLQEEPDPVVLTLVMGEQLDRITFTKYFMKIDDAMATRRIFAMVVDISGPQIATVDLPRNPWSLVRSAALHTLRGVAFVIDSVTLEQIKVIDAFTPPGVSYAVFADRTEATAWARAAVTDLILLTDSEGKDSVSSTQPGRRAK